MNFNFRDYIVEETLTKVTIVRSISIDSSFVSNTVDYIESFKNFINARDSGEALLRFLTDPRNISLNDSNSVDIIKELIEEFIELNNEVDLQEVELTLHIFKKYHSNAISLYSIDAFTKFIGNFTTQDLINHFYKEYSNMPYVVYDLQTDQISFNTEKFYYTNDFVNFDYNKIIQRIDMSYKRDRYCNFVNGTDKYSPSDFRIIDTFNIPINLIAVFERVVLVLSITYISNLSSIDKNVITFKIDGYKSANIDICLDSLSNNFELSYALFDIFKWIYDGDSSISDKLGIARNIITLNYNEDKPFTLSENTVDSIQSGYEIYLKENSQRYIEVVTQQLKLVNELNEETQDMSSDFGKAFAGNFLGFLSFFLTTFLFNAMAYSPSSGTEKRIFTYETTMLAICILVISFLFFIINLLMIPHKVNQVKKKYKRNKEFYSSLLTKKDLDRILNKGSYLNEDIESAFTSIFLFGLLWFVSIFLIGVFIVTLGDFTPL